VRIIPWVIAPTVSPFISISLLAKRVYYSEAFQWPRRASHLPVLSGRQTKCTLTRTEDKPHRRRRDTRVRPRVVSSVSRSSSSVAARSARRCAPATRNVDDIDLLASGNRCAGAGTFTRHKIASRWPNLTPHMRGPPAQWYGRRRRRTPPRTCRTSPGRGAKHHPSAAYAMKQRSKYHVGPANVALGKCLGHVPMDHLERAHWIRAQHRLLPGHFINQCRAAPLSAPFRPNPIRSRIAHFNLPSPSPSSSSHSEKYASYVSCPCARIGSRSTCW
jgi:hypothetical protein